MATIGKCKIKGCEKIGELRKGMCRKHERNVRIYGVFNPPYQHRGLPTTYCKIADCGKKNHSHKLCSKHHYIFLKWGDPLHKPPTREQIYHSSYIKRKPDECWPWIRRTDKNGYGKIGFKGWHTDRAHRFGWELFHKTRIPKRMCICHACDNPPCQNPAHLFLGTNRDNMVDKIKKGRLVANPYHGKDGRFTFKK